MKGLKRSLDRGNSLEQHIIKSTLQMDALFLPMTNVPFDTAWGTIALDRFKKGNVLFLGARADIIFAKTDANISNTFEGIFSFGTEPSTSNADLVGAFADLIPAFLLGPASSGVTSNERAWSLTQAGEVFDNTDSSLDVNLNIHIFDDSIFNHSALLVTGNITTAYLLLGDDDN